MSKKYILIACVVASILSGCRGRAAHPVQVIQDRDYNMTCNQLYFEMKAIENHTSKLHKERAGSNAGNVAAIAGSIIFLPAIAFVDLSKAERVELDAYKSRYEHLNELMHNKHCEVIGINEPASKLNK
ncbi:hypothetical protein [Candidatus Jidaibacter acanthamoebae]|nr:hypothetical protein [Candidatus Jidaibacter acanthamoeba]